MTIRSASAPRTEPIAPPSLAERARGAYLGLAIGDALGATVEFMTAREIEHQYGRHREIIGGGWLHLRPGQVTDDTGMALALGEAILSRGAVEAEAVAEAFSDWMRAKPVDIGNTVRRGIMRYRLSGETASACSEHDAGNGAAMRLLPAALYSFGRGERVRRQSLITQAHVTHNNPLSDAACDALCRLLHAAWSGEPVDTLLLIARQLVKKQPEFRFRPRPEVNPSGFIVHTMRAVLQCLFDNDGFESALVDIVNRGGDADTTGAITGMLAGALWGEQSIPQRWLDALNADIRARLVEQAEGLLLLGKS